MLSRWDTFEKYFESLLRARFAHCPPLLESVLYSCIQGGGKRFRARLVMSVAQWTGSNLDRALAVGATIEMIHAYSLIHDDLPAMDDDDYRRGQLSSHRKFGEATAILTGDALLSDAFGVLCAEFSRLKIDSSQTLEVLQTLVDCSGARGMIRGQILDLGIEEPELNLGVQQIHLYKTGALIRAAVVLGAENLTPENRTRLENLGDAIGLLFQIRDDILDVTGNLERLGKTPGKDALQGKLTFVTKWGLEGAQTEALKVHSQIEQGLQNAPFKGDRTSLDELLASLG